MTLTIFNTATRQKEAFQPIDPGHIKMYVCGPTVYNLIHIGNARPAVVFDVLYRLLLNEFPKVTYARNVTDIDDKIIKAAKENGEDFGLLASRFAEEYHADVKALGTLPPAIEPYATDHIDQMIDMVSRLIDSGNAYEAEGHVLFSVESMPEYGRLSNRSIDEMLDGARVEVAPYKRYAGDFVLWKPSENSDPGWDSPWGRGRPGWHLECSAMIEAHLGDTIDIHGGGRDLIFPHHENEMAQSCCAHGGKEYVRYWMHNGYLNIDGEKMSKSLGNFRTVRDLLDSYRGEVIRFALLSAHYRSELDFSADLLKQAKATLDSLYGSLREAGSINVVPVSLADSPVYKALLDDLNTPIAIRELHQIARELKKSGEGGEKARLKSTLLASGEILGLLQEDPETWFKSSAGQGALSDSEIDALISKRKIAKSEKDFESADSIRSQLLEKGVQLEDTREGTIWRRI